MLNHTYTSVKNANLVDCGKKQHIPSQPLPLLRNNFLGEYRTELDKKKVLANLGIATNLSLEWEYIKGDIGRSEALMGELDSRTKYISQIDGFYKTVIEGIEYLETVVGGEQEGEEEQNNRLTTLEQSSKELGDSLNTLKTYITETIDVNIETLLENLNTVTEKVNNITNLIQVSTKANNALILIPENSEDLQEGETPGLYVHDLSEEISTATYNIEELQENVKDILDTYVTKEELGGGDFDFVNQDDFNTYIDNTEDTISDIQEELAKTVKTGEDGHVDTLYVNKISKNNDDGNIVITDSFEVTEGIPLDIRFVVKDLELLYSLKPLVCYPGMGVIVSSQASLYILREPVDGNITDEYIQDTNSWKCPEDLIIEVLTQEEYDKKLEEGNINPNMFYYIHEEVIDEPLRKDFASDEEYLEALNKWLRVLQQKYMSAVWGQEIEELVANKASTSMIESLETEINNISAEIKKLSGGETNTNLYLINVLVLNNINDIQLLSELYNTTQQSLSDLQTNINDNYVTIDSITNEESEIDYIFVKNSEFNSYKQEQEKEISTKKLVLENLSLEQKESNLVFNNNEIALNKNVPVINVLSEDNYNNLNEKDENVYYYIYDLEENYVLNSEFSLYKTLQNTNISNLENLILEKVQPIGSIEELTTNKKDTIVDSINEIKSSLDDVINNIGTSENLPEGITTVWDAIKDLYAQINTLAN